MSDTNKKPTGIEASSAYAESQQDKPRATSPVVLILAVVCSFLFAWILSRSFNTHVAKPDTSLTDKQAELDVRLSNANRKRQELGYAPLQGFGSEDSEKIAARLSKDAVTLANYSDSFRTQLTEKDRLLDQRSQELIANEQARSSLTAQLAKLQNELDSSRLQSTSAEQLRQKLAQSDRLIADLRAQISQSSSRPSTEELTAAKARILDLEAQLTAIQLAPAPEPKPAPTLSQPSKLFAESEADLLPRAQTLYRALSELDDKSDSENVAAYNRFGTKLKASYLKQVNFDTGSSTLKPTDKFALTDALADMPKGSMILVVGYASTIGHSDANRSLSSNRATEVANSIKMDHPDISPIQAVFLGQTKRFSSRIPERNQVCEVWALLP